jgi:hypothetical protein
MKLRAETIANLDAVGITPADVEEWGIRPVAGNIMDRVPVLGHGSPTQRGCYWFQVGWMLGPMDDVKEEGRPVLRELMREILQKKRLLFENTPDMPGTIDVVQALFDELLELSALCERFRKTLH